MILSDLSRGELEELMMSFDQPRFRGGQLFKWLSRGADFDEMTDLPRSLLERLKQNYVARGVEIIKALRSSDGSQKFLYSLTGGDVFEGVYMPHEYGDTLCVSTQVGCRMGCAFCASGIGGLARNLSPGEILGQVAAVSRLLAADGKRLSNLVLMGSGEPLDNYDNVVKFLRLVVDENGIGIGQRNISLSTCGLPLGMRKLADDGFSVTLSVSLHATSDIDRQKIMPIAKKNSISEVIAAAKYYFEKTGRRIIYEYSLIKGVNMNFFDAKRLAELTKGYPAHVNLIMLNPVEEKNLNGCRPEEARRFMQRLKALGVSCSLRKSFGADIGGACGQLRRQYIGEKDPVSKP